jgi:type I restriction enzyme R subunit
MVVTSGIERAIQYFHAFRDYLAERKSRYRAIVAFSGEHEYGGITGYDEPLLHTMYVDKALS